MSFWLAFEDTLRFATILLMLHWYCLSYTTIYLDTRPISFFGFTLNSSLHPPPDRFALRLDRFALDRPFRAPLTVSRRPIRAPSSAVSHCIDRFALRQPFRAPSTVSHAFVDRFALHRPFHAPSTVWRSIHRFALIRRFRLPPRPFSLAISRPFRAPSRPLRLPFRPFRAQGQLRFHRVRGPQGGQGRHAPH